MASYALQTPHRVAHAKPPGPKWPASLPSATTGAARKQAGSISNQDIVKIGMWCRFFLSKGRTYSFITVFDRTTQKGSKEYRRIQRGTKVYKGFRRVTSNVEGSEESRGFRGTQRVYKRSKDSYGFPREILCHSKYHMKGIIFLSPHIPTYESLIINSNSKSDCSCGCL